MIRAVVLLLLLSLAAGPGALAVQPDEVLDDTALEARARALSKEIRCLVCQNQSIDDSNAALARDLRLIVRERLVAGDSDGEVLDYLVDRYGDFVLLNPPMKPSTWLLWFSPVVVLMLGAVAVAVYLGRRRRPEAAVAPLTEAERAELDRLIGDDGADPPAGGRVEERGRP